MINKPEELKNITEQKNFIVTLKEIEKNVFKINSMLDNINDSIEKLNNNFDKLSISCTTKEKNFNIESIDDKIDNIYSLVKEMKNNDVTNKTIPIVEEIKEDCFKNKEPINIYMKNGSMFKNVLLYKNKSIDSILSIGEILNIIKTNKNEVLIFISENLQGTLVTCVIDKIELSGQS